MQRRHMCLHEVLYGAGGFVSVTGQQLFDVDLDEHEKIRGNLSEKEENRLVEEYSEHREPFENSFTRDFPPHPYKTFQKLRKRVEPEGEELAALIILKERYVEQWKRFRNRFQNQQR